MLTFISFNFFLFLFKVCLVFCSFWVIFSLNPIHSVIFLILVFFNGAIIFLLLKAEFLAIIYMVIYMGAIAVLFLFVVMMLEFKSYSDNSKQNYFFLGLIILITLVLQICLYFYKIYISKLQFIGIFNNNEYYYFDWFNYIYDFSNLEILGQVIYTYFFLFFIFSGLILLVAMIASISLTLSDKLNSKKQFIFNQIARQSNNTIYIF